MKTGAYFSFILVSAAVLVGCKKNDGGSSSTPKTPILTTTTESAITSSSAKSGGTITSDGGSTITARGVCWSDVNAYPTIADTKTNDGVGTGAYTSAVTGLKPYDAYYVRAYATNGNGTGYGNAILFLTLPGVTVKTGEVYVDNHKRLCRTEITIHGFNTPNAPTVTQTGVCWGKSQNPTIADTKMTSGPVTDIFALYINGGLLFDINSTLYIRGYATTSTGTIYGNQVTYTTGVDIGLGTGGGIIFFVDNTGQHGLVAALTDQGTRIPWAPGNLYTTATTATSSSDGAANTTKIISKYGNSGSYAAKLCRDYKGGGFTDWYLPASNQLDYMKTQQDLIGGFPSPVFLTNYFYWSSTENNYFRAWRHDTNPNYFLVDAIEKNTLCSVRAIRAF
jgi:hypothetical protein